MLDYCLIVIVVVTAAALIVVVVLSTLCLAATVAFLISGVKRSGRLAEEQWLVVPNARARASRARVVGRYVDDNLALLLRSASSLLLAAIASPAALPTRLAAGAMLPGR